jgi:hypothetical protein
VSGSGPLRISLPAAGAWQVCPDLEGHWSGCEKLVLEPAQLTAATLPLLRRGEIEGSFDAAPSGHTRPTHMTLEFAPSKRSGSTIARSRIECPVDSAGQWRCRPPRGLLDVVVRPHGFTPAYRWGVEVGEARKQLGGFALHRGASLVGQVIVEGAELVPGAAEVRLTPYIAAGAEGREAGRLSTVEYRAAVQASGFFQIEHAAPGVYGLEAIQGKLGVRTGVSARAVDRIGDGAA